MKRFIKYQNIAILICFLPFLAFLISDLTRYYRYSDLRYIYSTGVLAVYFLWGASFALGLINVVIILSKEKKLAYKLLWCFVSLLPIIYLVIMLAFVFLRDLINGTFQL